MASNTKRRGGHRSVLSTLIPKVDAELGATTPDQTRLRTLRDEITYQRTNIFDFDNLIQAECADEATLATDISEASVYRMNSSLALNKIADYLRSIESTTPTTSQPQSRQVKLPAISLLTFDGSPLQWPTFWDLFKSSIHDRTDISAPAKFHYLISQLRGDAKNLLTGFEHSEGEYHEAVDLLKDTYGKPKLLVQARLHAILDLQAPEPTSTGLSKFRSSFEGHLRALKSFGCDIDASGYVYATILMRKLPKRVFDNINRANASDHWALDDLRKAIDLEVNLLRATEDSSIDKSNLSQNELTYSSASLPVSSGKTKDFSKRHENTRSAKCQFCFSDQHFSNQCDKYETFEKRQNRVKELRICFNCLGKNHTVSICKSQNTCRICSAKHHTSICNKKEKSVENNSDSKSNETSLAVTSIDKYSGNILPTAQISIGSEKSKTHALFDICSQKSFVVKSLSDKLNLNIIGSIYQALDGFGNVGERKNYDIVKIPVHTNEEIINVTALVVETLPERIHMNGRSEAVKLLKNKNLNLADDNDQFDLYTNIEVLIGVDHYFEFVFAQKAINDLYLIPSKLGNLIAGNVLVNNSSVNAISTVLEICHDQTCSEIENIWKLDSIGIDDSLEINDQFAVENFNKTVSFENGKYSVGLPWKIDPKFLPENFELSRKRLFSVWNSLNKEPEKLQFYDRIIKDQLKADYIEKVDIDHNIPCHYLPHHCVLKNSNTTPIRIVYDCSAKTQNSLSLKDCLFTGPSLLNDLCSILLRFRTQKYACVSDIAKAFLQVGLNLEDRNFCRFLWFSDPFDQNSEIISFRFKVVLFGSTSSQFLLNATLKKYLTESENNFAQKIYSDIYVDNLISSFPTEKELLNYYHVSKNLLAQASFNLREWNSNSQALKNILTENKEYPETTTKVLGLNWNTEQDSIFFEDSNVFIVDKPTKRTVVSEVSKLFDPLGILLPFTILLRIFIQKLWKANISWDCVLPQNLVLEWEKLVFDLKKILKITIPRNVTIYPEMSIHIFADASSLAYGCICYLVHEMRGDLVLAKSKVAPIKSKSLPQLELTAINLAARMAVFIKNSYKNMISFLNTVIWTDSQICLHWIHNKNKVKKPYVIQRLKNIFDLVPEAKFNFIPGKMNPADSISRGIPSSQFFKNLEHWLQLPQDILENSFEINHEKFSYEIETSAQLQICSETSEKSNFLDFLDNCHNFQKCVNVVMYVRRFVNICRKIKLVDIVTEKNEAEILLFKLCQKTFFSNEYSYLDNKSGKIPSIVKQLDLYMQNGLIRCYGRLEKTQLKFETKFPILIPSKSRLTDLLIFHVHRQSFHSGVSDTLSSLREKFWIPKARQRIKNVLRSCVLCKMVQGKPILSPPVAPLPSERVLKSQPFTVVGIDFTGAIHAKRGENIFKVYMLLFTCAVTRAVHLEIVEDGSEREFLNAFRKFVSRRTIPEIIISDNAKVFISASKTLKELFDSAQVSDYMNKNKILWKFIPARAAWFGGFYERLVGITKIMLKKVLGKNLLSVSDLSTIVTEIECRVNNRPLTYSSNDLNDPIPISPSQLMYGYKPNTLPNSFDRLDLEDLSYGYHNDVKLKLSESQKTLDYFWERWAREYLVGLREFHRSSNNGKDSLNCGDVVLIHSDKPRVFWQMGIVTEKFEGDDGFTRSVRVKTNVDSLIRPVTKCYPLEINCMSFVNSKNTNNSRPLRLAAIKARRDIVEQLK